MPTERTQVESEFYVNRDFLRDLQLGRQAFLARDDTYPPPAASWWEQMTNYFRGDPPAYRVNLPLKKIRWEADDQQIIVSIQELPAETLAFQYKTGFKNWLAGVIDFLLYRFWQIFMERPSLSIGLIAVVVSYLIYEG